MRQAISPTDGARIVFCKSATDGGKIVFQEYFLTMVIFHISEIMPSIMYFCKEK